MTLRPITIPALRSRLLQIIIKQMLALQKSPLDKSIMCTPEAWPLLGIFRTLLGGHYVLVATPSAV